MAPKRNIPFHVSNMTHFWVGKKAGKGSRNILRVSEWGVTLPTKQYRPLADGVSNA